MEKDPVVQRQLQGHKAGITCVAFNPKDRTLATGDTNNAIMIWLQGHTGAVLDLSFSNKTNLLASASQDRTVRLWVPTLSGRTTDFRAHFSAVRSVHFSPDGDKLVTGSDDKSVKLWSVEGTRRFITSMTQHSNWVRCTRFSDSGNLVGSCADDCSAILWDVREPKKPVQMLEGFDSSPNYLAFQPREDTVFGVGFSSGHVRIYDMRAPQHLLQKYNVSNTHVNQIAFHPTGHVMLAACASGEIKVLDLLEGRPIYTLTIHKSTVTGVAFSPSGNTFASVGEDKQVVLWRANEGCVSPAPRTPSAGTPRTPISATAKTSLNRTPIPGDPRSPMYWRNNEQTSLAKNLKKLRNSTVSGDTMKALEERVKRLEVLLQIPQNENDNPNTDLQVPALEKRILGLEQRLANNEPEKIGESGDK